MFDFDLWENSTFPELTSVLAKVAKVTTSGLAIQSVKPLEKS